MSLISVLVTVTFDTHCIISNKTKNLTDLSATLRIRNIFASSVTLLQGITPSTAPEIIFLREVNLMMADRKVQLGYTKGLPMLLVPSSRTNTLILIT